MSTIADVFTVMSLLDNELDLDASGIDEARGIAAINVAQHYFETLAATMPRVLGSTINVSTTINTETTTWPTTLLRLDAIWALDDTTSKPLYSLRGIDDVGGHTPSLPWPLTLGLATGSGMPAGYFANMSQFFWVPLPDGSHSCRVYGLLEQDEYTARGNTFAYPKRTKHAFATFACKILKTGVGDDTAALDTLAGIVFGPLMKGLRKFDRSHPISRVYGSNHDA